MRRIAAWTCKLMGYVAPEESAGVVAVAPPVAPRLIFRRFWPYARRYRGWLAVTFVLACLTPALDTAAIWLFKVMVDSVLVPRQLGPFAWLVLAYVALTFTGGVITFVDDYLSAWVGERFLLDVRTTLFAHLQTLSPSFFARRRLGDVVARLNSDVASIEQLVLSFVADATSYVLKLAFFGAALFYLSWQLALVSLIVVPAFWLAARRFSGRIQRASREKRRRSGSISAVAEESLTNLALVQAYNRQDAELRRFGAESVGSLRAQVASARLKALFSPVIDLIELAGVLAVIGMGTWELSRGRLSLGGLLAFLAYLSQLYGPIRSLAGLSNTFYSASASAERIIEFLDERPAVSERPGAAALSRPRGRIEFAEVSFRYPGATHDALVGASFSLEPGDTLAITGPSGAGKSTVVNLLLRFFDPDRGRIALDGFDLRELTLGSLRDSVAVVLQETLIFDASVTENIAFGRPDASEAEIVRAAKAADAHDFIAVLPEGYESVVGQRGRRLSGGQRQRIAIARAILRDAPLLLLDEPTAGLDAASAQRILSPLAGLMAGRSTIIATHDPAVVAMASRVAVIEEGRLREIANAGTTNAHTLIGVGGGR